MVTNLARRVNPASAISRSRIHGRVAHSLAVDIIAGRLAPGDTLPNETQPVDGMTVSRVAYREAVKILGAKGLVATRPKIGTRVAPRSSWNLLDPDVLAWHFEAEPDPSFIRALFEIRGIVEPSAAALAAERRSDEDLVAIGSALEGMAQAPTGTLDGLQFDLDFHLAILAAVENEPLRSLGPVIESTLRWSVKLTLQRFPSAHRDALPEHVAVFEAIAARAPDEARAQMRGLVENALSDTLKAIARPSHR